MKEDSVLNVIDLHNSIHYRNQYFVYYKHAVVSKLCCNIALWNKVSYFYEIVKPEFMF